MNGAPRVNDVPLVQYRDLCKRFDDHVVFDGLSLTVRRAEAMVVVGASGTGKSLLLRMLNRLASPDAGAVLLDGRDVATAGRAELVDIRRRVSMLFQQDALFDSMSVFDNVSYPLRIRDELDEAEVSDRVTACLERVGLPDIEALMPSALSGGMQKRVALARAIIAEPEIVLYDEPTAGLDPMNARRVSELIVELRDQLGMTSIIVTHDMPSAFLVADRIALLKDRRIYTVMGARAFQRARDTEVRRFVHAMSADVTLEDM